MKTNKKITLEKLAEGISQMIDIKDAPLFMAMLEKQYANWAVAVPLIKHYKKLEVLYNDEMGEGEGEDLSAKYLVKPF